MSAMLYLLPNRIAETEPEVALPAQTIEFARKCRRFLAENAKSARAFLKAIGHPGPIADLEIIEIGHEPKRENIGKWLEPVANGVDTAIVSESGCPAVADPGATIVRVAHRMGIRVKPLVGPSSILLTVMASGLDGQRFRFWGYLPIKDEERKNALRFLEKESARSETELFIETPYRNNHMLESLTVALKPATLVTVATDVTGTDECIRTMTAREWKKHLGTLPKVPTVFALMA